MIIYISLFFFKSETSCMIKRISKKHVLDIFSNVNLEETGNTYHSSGRAILGLFILILGQN